ncbi:MAG: hypothetical protein KKB21_03690 [Nanoarchaeota archaeon]|nr:hypothetical protein [Nanoarchaeota archaeon]MBU4086651.1 hypothetical protein [Nanoarchaeota archaeon]
MQNEETLVRIDEQKQKELFQSFIRKFNGDFGEASKHLNVTRSHLSRCKRGINHYIPKEVLSELIDYLRMEMPEILFSGSLNEVRRNYMKEAHVVLEGKYGENWAKELTNRRDFRGIHLADFPDYIFVYLEEDYRKQLFNAAYNLFCSLGNLAKFIKVSPSRLSSWFYGKQKDYERNVTGLQFIPLSKLKIISQKLTEDSREEFSMENIENKITMYRMQAGNHIQNPVFPVRESPELVRLLFHLLGDGYAGGISDNANYRNTCQELLDEFKADLKIFGDVPVYEQTFSIKFPRVLAEIVENYYGIDSKTFNSRISNKILQIPKRDLYFGIRAFADDEGTVYSSSVRLSSANSPLLAGIKEIFVYLKIKTGDIKSQMNKKATFGKTYYLDIKDIEKYHHEIGFTHPKKKMLLEKYVKNKKSKRRKKLLKS